MLSSPIGRSRFFLYSVALVIVEALLVIVSIAATMGVAALAESPPGPSREGLALAIFVVTAACLLVRSNLAWRRGRDAQLPKWQLVAYIGLSTMFVILQALTFLVYDFGTKEGGDGLGLLGLALMAMWFRIWLAAPAGGSFDPDAFLEREGYAPRPAPMATQPASPQRAMPQSQPARASTASKSGGFGRRGLA